MKTLYLVNNMILTCCSIPDSNSITITDIGSISSIILASLTLVLAYYVFVYQRKKDNASDIKSAELYKKGIKLDWFKELIIQPRIDKVFDFYKNINSIRGMIDSNELDDTKKIELINFIKNEQSNLRKSFLDLVQYISSPLHILLKRNLDELTDSLTNSISDDELKLHNSRTYDRVIAIKIQDSYSKFLSDIFDYEG